MTKPFTTFAALLLFLLGLAQAGWIWKAANVSIDGAALPSWVPIAGFVVALLTSLGIFVESRRRIAAMPSPETVSRDIQRRPGKFTVKKDKRYKAKISLGFFEQVASNDMIVEKLQEAGFSDVHVTGSGGERTAIGRWSGADTSAEMPSQVVSATEIVEPTITASLTAAASKLAPDR